jgi:hypothetical protein
VLKGNLTSTADVTMTGAFSVGDARDLHWDLPRVVTVHESGYAEDVTALDYAFDVQPDSFSDTVVDGRPVRVFVWDNPPSQTVIHVTETFKATVRSNLTPFHSSTPYPLTDVPDVANPWLAITPLVKLPAGSQSLLDRFTRGAKSEEAVVASVVDWVAANTSYDATRTGSFVSAASVLSSHRAICRGYDNLTAGILRALGIPVRIEYGWVSANRLNLPGPQHGHSFVQWSVPGTQGELHTWLSVYFPDAGWVPVDAQREKFFVDPHHLAFYSTIDAGIPVMGQWSAEDNDTDDPTGAALSNGDVEIVPGDGNASTVTVRSKDQVHATVQSFKHDVNGVLLFAR